jgi:hypothetical protein
MCSRKIGSATSSENVATRPHKFTTSEKKTAVIRKMGGRQSCPTVFRDLNMTLSTVTTITKLLIKLKRQLKMARKENCYSSHWGLMSQIMKETFPSLPAFFV